MAVKRSTPIVNFLPFLSSVIAFVLVLLILLGGTSPAVESFFFIKFDVSDLNVPSALSGSTLLKDIGSVSGADLVGQAATAQTLGLAPTYTVSLLASCAVDPGKSTVCSPPRLGFRFDPATDLRLSRTPVAEEALSSKLGVLEAYDRVSGFLAFAYIAGAAFVLLAPSLALIAACTSRASTLSFLSAVLAAAASLFLLSASIASVVIFVALRDAFNSALGPVGIRVSLSSRLFVTSFVAFLLSLAIAIVLSLRSRRAAPLGRLPPNRGMGMGPNGYADNKGTAADDNSDAGKAYNAAAVSYQPRSGLLGRVATWNRHRYVQIEKQPALVTDRRHEGSSAVLMDVNGTRSRGRGPMEDDEDWTSGDANEDDYAHPGRRITEAEAANGGAQKPQESIAMVSLRGGKLMDVNTAYEPYKSMTAKET